jgi:hypothetical protein
MAKVGQKVLYGHEGKIHKAEIVRIDSGSTDADAICDLHVFGNADTAVTHSAGPGSIIFGRENVKPSASQKDGYWTPLPE